MSTALSPTFVPLEDFLEMQPEPGEYLEWSRSVVFRGMSSGSAVHARVRRGTAAQEAQLSDVWETRGIV